MRVLALLLVLLAVACGDEPLREPERWRVTLNRADGTYEAQEMIGRTVDQRDWWYSWGRFATQDEANDFITKRRLHRQDDREPQVVQQLEFPR